MALGAGDFNWQGYGKVTDADSTSGWSVIKTTSGGGTPSVALADGGLQGATSAQAITTTSNNKRILLYYDIGSGNELNFSSLQSEENQFVWVWGSFLAAALLEPVASDGFGIMLGTDNGGTVDWSVWTFFGSDNYAGGWRRMVIDPTKTASMTGSGSSEGGGGISINSVRYFGIMAKTTATARFDNMLVDRIDVGTGYAIDGTGATADDLMADILAIETAVANYWGVIRALNDSENAYELLGKLTIGDNSGTVATTVSDVDSKIFAAEPLYYTTSFVAALPLDAIGIEIVGNGTGATSVTIGKAVGTEEGRNGWAVVGNDTYDVGIDWDDGNVNTNNWYGCSFENLTGVLSWGTNTSHKLFSCSFSGCAEFDPVGGLEIKNCTFANTSDTAAALLWNDNIDIESCNFIANTDGAGTRHNQFLTSPYTYNALNFSGNTFDVYNSSGSAITVNKTNGANPSTYEGVVVTFSASFILTLTDIPEGVQVTIVNSSTRSELQNSTAPAGGTVTYTHSGGETVDIMFMDVDYDPNVSDIFDLTLDNGDQSIKVSMLDDPNYSNP